MTLLGACALFACSLDEGAGRPGAGSGAAGAGGAGGASGSGGGGGDASTLPEPCGGQCKDKAKETCNANDECECLNGAIDIDPAQHSASCEAPINAVEVGLGIQHEFIGHLVARLWGPTGAVITLMSRPGFNETIDDGSESGPSAHKALLGSAPISLGSSGGSIEQVAAVGGPTLCDGGAPCNFTPFPGAAQGPTSLTQAFKGLRWSGSWKLCVGDAEAVAAGSLESFRVKVVTGEGVHENQVESLNQPIQDDAYDGSEGSMACASLTL
ncbi:MAG: hypothetical protein R3B13_35180 [Polyangiaceae bacterium]